MALFGTLLASPLPAANTLDFYTIDVEGGISNRWGIFAAGSQQQGKTLGNIDGLLVAAAFEHGLTVATRNTRHFEDMGVAIFDPWKG